MSPWPEVGDCGLQLLRLCVERHGVLPDRLDAEARSRVLVQARAARAIERLAISSNPQEAVDEDALAGQLQAFARWLGARDRARALRAVGLDEKSLRMALARELAFDRAARAVQAGVPAVTDAEVSGHFQRHAGRFAYPERRQARHILITVNECFVENRRATAARRAAALQRQLLHCPDAFPALARQHSECPSAMDGGLIGTLRPGQLYPRLDGVLFGLEAGAISAPVESPLGFHILRCERILPAGRLGLDQAAPAIRRELTEQHRRAARREWLARLANERAVPGAAPDALAQRV